MKPLDVANKSPRCCGTRSSNPSISFSAKGSASPTSSGSSSVAKLLVLWEARESPSLLMANFLTEQPVLATTTTTKSAQIVREDPTNWSVFEHAWKPELVISNLLVFRRDAIHRRLRDSEILLRLPHGFGRSPAGPPRWR